MHWRHTTRALMVVFCLAAGLPGVAAAAPSPSNRQTDVLATAGGDLRLMPIFHGSVMLEYHGLVIDVDPWSGGDFSGLPPADLILITHTHADHLDRSMVDRLHKPDTVIVGSPAVVDTLNCAPMCGRLEVVGDADHKTVLGIGIQGVPMYNIQYGPAAGIPWHHRGVGSGFVLDFAGTRVYFSGDTECTPEMKALRDIAVAFIAMNPPRTSSTQQAAACVLAFKPRIVYPYHYRGSDTQQFAAALHGSGITVRLRALEGEAPKSAAGN